MLVLLLSFSAFASVPVPTNLKVSSKNFIHILEWSPGNGTQPGTVYNVKINNHQERNITGTYVDVSKYMKKIHHTYKIQLWASFGSDSSAPVSITFMPSHETFISPPTLSLLGCGDCLNIDIDFPNRKANNHFYNAIGFLISWRKARDEKDGCHNPFTTKQNRHFMSYSNVLEHLQPGEKYCVEVQPKSNIISKYELLSSCSCEFTSHEESRGVAFLAFLIFGSLLVGLCIVIPLFSLVYTGYLCKPKARLPEALNVFGPVYILFPEQTCISLVELGDGKPKEKRNGLSEQNNDDGDDDEEENEEIQNPYMDRGAQAESESTSSDRSASVSEIAENVEECRFEGAPADAKELYSPFQLHSGEVKGSNQAALFDTKAVNYQNAEEKPGGQIKEKENNAENDDSGNVNLWSVVLKSMQPEEDEADEAGQPLLPLFLKEFQEDSYAAARGSSFELHTLLIHTEFQASEDDKNDIPVARAGDHVKKGYMASYTGNIDAGRCLSDDDDEDDEETSGYMTR
ncbi:cytokine receptor family member b1 [Silurus asotus]|uniref:Cytokine receptor family member b1 n=1 Tax=Silurus asotus TaxID=30991 RepID=A0AAD5B4F6_SILAS|nr:cytokine receptor family member b1 [Silurus asotus]